MHALTCPIRRRWLRWRTGIPFWQDDKTAQMLGVAQYGCPRCGQGATEDVESDAPTMAQADCRCPDDCDCDGRFACEEQAGETLRFCELVVGHEGWHQAGNHRWQPGVFPPALPIHRTEAGYPNCATCDGGGCLDCTDPT